ncbi:hypothetical protein [Streptomyces curacoi]|uniref:hypothetical protein n=1 Tax=Streptomyces curacoi TaxID=146536 RepID=UPI00131C5B5F|nr:hypothetical protein [Streptomyces curacoi]
MGAVIMAHPVVHADHFLHEQLGQSALAVAERNGGDHVGQLPRLTVSRPASARTATYGQGLVLSVVHYRQEHWNARAVCEAMDVETAPSNINNVRLKLKRLAER